MDEAAAFGSGHDLRVLGSGSSLDWLPAQRGICFSLSPLLLLSLSLDPALSLSSKQIKSFKNSCSIKDHTYQINLIKLQDM